jgi:hypothetical protein
VSEPLTEQQLSEIKARADAATPGPWKAFVINDDDLGEPMSSGIESIDGSLNHGEECEHFHPYDREFIAHARADVPALLEEVARLRAEVEALRPAAANWQMVCEMPVDTGLIHVLVDDHNEDDTNDEVWMWYVEVDGLAEACGDTPEAALRAAQGEEAQS